MKIVKMEPGQIIEIERDEEMLMYLPKNDAPPCFIVRPKLPLDEKYKLLCEQRGENTLVGGEPK